MKARLLFFLCCTGSPLRAGPGDLDFSFGTGGLVTDSVYAAASLFIQDDGKILTAGARVHPTDFRVATVVTRHLPDGTFDPDFADHGKLFGPEGGLSRVVKFPDGRILAAGSAQDDNAGSSGFALFQFLPDGTIDRDFGENGQVVTDVGSESDGANGLFVLPDGKILIGGPSCSNDDDCGITSTLTLLRYSASGVPDATFGNGGLVRTGIHGGEFHGSHGAFALQDDGKILVFGAQEPNGIGWDVLLKRYDSSGALDTSFGTDGLVVLSFGEFDVPRAFEVLADGKILIMGVSSLTPNGYMAKYFLRRLTPDGATDPEFIPDQVPALPNEGAWLLRELPDGRVLVGGGASGDGLTPTRAVVWRLQPNGSPDTGFGPGGAATFQLGPGDSDIQFMDVQADGKILLIGRRWGDPYGFVLARLHSSGPEISVTSTAGVEFAFGAAALDFVSLFPGGQSGAQTLVVRNTGPEPLELDAPIISGPDAADFRLNISGPPAPIAPGGQMSFTVTFVPTHRGIPSASLSLPHNDGNESPFTFVLNARAFSTANDTDGDGLNDWAEVKLAALGFDWQVANPEKVSALSDGAGAAGLYTLSRLQSLHVGTPLLARDPATGSFRLTMALEKSVILTEFQPLPMTEKSTRINAAGNLEFDFTTPEENAFFRILASPGP
jgi:uncharacterized delta-60 repeat protein